MEKSRAIELLKLAVPIKALTQQEYADFVEAVNMGMDALEQPTSPDTIDRKAALDALRKCQTYLYDARDPELKIELSSAEAAINNLLTIQPEKEQLSKEGATSDTISRQATIDAVNNAFDRETLLTGLVRSIAVRAIRDMPSAQPEPQWIPVSERLPNKEERKEWIDNNLDGIGYLYPCLVTRYSSINPDRTKNNPYVAKHYFDGEDFLNAGEEVCSEYIIAWMPLPEAYKPNNK